MSETQIAADAAAPALPEISFASLSNDEKLKHNEAFTWFVTQTMVEATAGLYSARDWFANFPELLTAAEDDLPLSFRDAAKTGGIKNVVPEYGMLDPDFSERALQFAMKSVADRREKAQGRKA